jgi:hypothetical protein
MVFVSCLIYTPLLVPKMRMTVPSGVPQFADGFARFQSYNHSGQVGKVNLLNGVMVCPFLHPNRNNCI